MTEKDLLHVFFQSKILGENNKIENTSGFTSLTVLLEVDFNLVGLGADDPHPHVARLLLGPRRDVAPVEAAVRQLDASQAEAELSRIGLGEDQVVPEAGNIYRNICTSMVGL